MQEFVVARFVLAHDEGVNLFAFGNDHFRRGTRESDGVCWTQLRFGVNGLGDDRSLAGKEPLRFGAGGSPPPLVIPVNLFRHGRFARILSNAVLSHWSRRLGAA